PAARIPRPAPRARRRLSRAGCSGRRARACRRRRAGPRAVVAGPGRAPWRSCDQVRHAGAARIGDRVRGHRGRAASSTLPSGEGGGGERDPLGHRSLGAHGPRRSWRQGVHAPDRFPVVIPESSIRAFAETAWVQGPRFEIPLPDVGGAVLLDLGGGPGVYARALVERGAARVCWVDASATLESIAREKLADLSGVEFRLADMGDLSAYPDQSFDGVLFRDALHHALDEARVLREVARVLKPGGWLYLEFPT